MISDTVTMRYVRENCLVTSLQVLMTLLCTEQCWKSDGRRHWLERCNSRGWSMMGSGVRHKAKVRDLHKIPQSKSH